MDQDLEHLRLLSIFHYIVGALAALFSCLPFIHLAIGVAIVNGAMGSGAGQQSPPTFVGWILIAVAAVLIFIGWSIALAILVAGRFLARRTHLTYCFVVGGIECLFMPFGTVLGIFTIILLMRPTVKPLFQQNAG